MKKGNVFGAINDAMLFAAFVYSTNQKPPRSKSRSKLHMEKFSERKEKISRSVLHFNDIERCVRNIQV